MFSRTIPRSTENSNDDAALYQKLRHPRSKAAITKRWRSSCGTSPSQIKRDDYPKQAINEFEKADHEFKLARNPVYREDVKNNVGLILFNLSRYKEAHKDLDEARRLAVRFNDKARTGIYSEWAAQVFIAEGKYKEAEAERPHPDFSLCNRCNKNEPFTLYLSWR